MAQSEAVIKEVGGDVGSGLVGLRVKGTCAGEPLSSGFLLDLQGPETSKHQNKDILNTKGQWHRARL